MDTMYMYIVAISPHLGQSGGRLVRDLGLEAQRSRQQPLELSLGRGVGGRPRPVEAGQRLGLS